MDYWQLNELNKKQMSGTCGNDTHFEWEDENLMSFLLGNLPELKAYSADGKMPTRFHELSKAYHSYNFMETESSFMQEITAIATSIYDEMPNWYGINLPLVEDVMHAHKSCLISGEGGIGKSYFVKCLEQELAKKGTKHLCVYGKFCKDPTQIDFEEIARIGEYEEFVFAFDAINEISDVAQKFLLEGLQRIKPTRGVRIVVTYRHHAVDEHILQGYRELADMHYDFPGISFESAVEWLRKMPIEDITEYLDVLYSNNPFLIGKLRYIMESGWDNSLNNISRFTYIYEQLIKRTLSRPTWLQTKKVAEFMYQAAKKEICYDELSAILDNSREFILEMECAGFLTYYTYEGKNYYTFPVESLADYLIARSMLDDLKNKTEDECINIIIDKINKLYSIKEMVILLLFDLFSTDYDKIKHILVETGLLEELTYDVMVKIHFTAENIKPFLRCFSPMEPHELIEFFAGYPNKPFNCTYFLNDYYLSVPQAQTIKLSKQLSKKHFLQRLISRLKNALYLVNKCECSAERMRENFYTALWCTAAGNQTVRLLAEKLLYDVLQRSHSLIIEAIGFFPQIYDYYIQESLIYALASCQHCKCVKEFFNELLSRHEFILGKSIRRMCEYLGNPSIYIELDKQNLFSEDNDVVSKDFEHLLFMIDLHEKELLPFRFRSASSFQENVKFLAVNRTDIAAFNSRIASDFVCVRDGDCSGSMGFLHKAEKHYSVSISSKLLNGNKMLASLEKAFQNVFSAYGLQLKVSDIKEQDEHDFSASLFRKCTCIAIDIFYGSMMCNYYLKDFATYNNAEDTIGFEIYNPIEYGETNNIRSPLSVYQTNVENMGDIVLCNLDLPENKDNDWWSDLDNAKENILKLIAPIDYKHNEWVLLAGRISVKGTYETCEWHDTYDVFCCTSSKETLNNDGNERYLTIEIDDYTGNLYDYPALACRPWLCNRVPTISYGCSVFEETMLTLPPANLITTLGLKLNPVNMCWEDANGEAIVICNNNMSSYYHNPIMSTVFIRKDAYDRLNTLLPIKYFAFSERYLSPMGYCDDTAMHFEIIDGEIVKSILNSDSQRVYKPSAPPTRCQKCKFGFYKPMVDGDYLDDLLEENPNIAELLKKYGA